MDIAAILLSNGLLTKDELEITPLSSEPQKAAEQVVGQGLVAEDVLLRALAQEFGTRLIDVSDIDVDPALVAVFPGQELSRLGIFPVERSGSRIVVATSDPFDFAGLDELGSAIGCELQPVYARRKELSRLIKDTLGLGGGIVGELLNQESPGDAATVLESESSEDDAGQQASVINLVNELLSDAVSQRASDIHIEPLDTALIIRFRIDGVLHVQPTPPEIRRFYSPIVTRLKIMSRLNIAEKRLPQDGRIRINVKGREIDLRTSIIPALYGEGVVLRILDREQTVFELDSLGLSPDTRAMLDEIITRPHGIILATGPTGSGKTSSLYSILNQLSDPSLKIVTLEDPVEYHLDAITQIQVHPKIGLTFASGLRSILRHDPDIILLGEIRDTETAESAIQASMTGHLVLSTLHTNDSSGALTRLVEMGVEPYLVSSAVEAVVAQRLVRVLCPHCKTAYCPDPDFLPADFPVDQMTELFQPAGCRECSGTGYQGRIGLFELLRSSDSIRRLCVERAASSTIRQHAIDEDGLVTLRQNGWQRVLQGVTSVEEVTQITRGAAGPAASSDAAV